MLYLCYIYVILIKISADLRDGFVLPSANWNQMHHHHYRHFVTIIIIVVVVINISSVAWCVRCFALHLSNWPGWKYLGWKPGKYSVIRSVWRCLSIFFSLMSQTCPSAWGDACMTGMCLLFPSVDGKPPQLSWISTWGSQHRTAVSSLHWVQT